MDNADHQLLDAVGREVKHPVWLLARRCLGGRPGLLRIEHQQGPPLEGDRAPVIEPTDAYRRRETTFLDPVFQTARLITPDEKSIAKKSRLVATRYPVHFFERISHAIHA